jgi:D-sedoheptulose 7-phosphate isomerase
MMEHIKNSINESASLIKNSVNLSNEIETTIEIILKSIKNGKKIILFGNGGSATDAQHMAAEFVGRFKINRKSIPAIALCSDTAILTSIANDFSYDMIFERQCESLIEKDDIVIGISTSGNSENVRKGILASKKKGAFTIGFLGNNGGIISKIVDLSLIVDSSNTPKIQEVHRVIYHIICDCIEKEMGEKR